MTSGGYQVNGRGPGLAMVLTTMAGLFALVSVSCHDADQPTAPVQVNSVYTTFSDQFQHTIAGTYERSVSCDKSQSLQHHVSGKVRSNLGGSPGKYKQSSDELKENRRHWPSHKRQAFFVF